MAKHTLFQRAAIFLLETFGNQTWGFRPNLIAPFVEQKGSLPALFWFANTIPKYERILESWGPIRTHLLATEISALNGCRYCTNGHAYALQLHYLKATEQLFPLSEADILAVMTLPEGDILARFEQALEQADLSAAILDMRRMAELRQSEPIATTAKDRDILHLIKMFSVLSACGVRGNVRIDQAHDPINKNRAWRDRYAILRRAQTRMPAKAVEPEVTVLNPSDLYL
ncbi:MAG: hypothetical protein AAFY72_02965 [Cyanobacteria bacterium J06649_4]